MADLSAWRWFFQARMRVARRTLAAIAILGLLSAGVVAARSFFIIPRLEFGTEIAALNGLILAFLVGFRNNAAYERWWEARQQWGRLVNDSRNLCLKYREYAQPTPEERRRMADLVSQFAVALMGHLMTAMDQPRARHEPTERAAAVYGEIARLVRERRLDSIQAQMLDEHASGLLSVSGACERIRGTPLADSYRALLRHGMIVQLVALVVLTTFDLGALGIPLVLIAAYFLIGMELVAEDIENPFGTDGDDLPLDQYCQTIRRSAEQILGPPPQAA